MARQRNIFIDQGTDVNFLIDVLDEDDEPIDLTGYTARAKMRKHWASANSVAFTCDINSDSQIVMSMTNEETNTLAPGRYVYDCELVSSSDVVIRAVEGIATVKPSASYE